MSNRPNPDALRIDDLGARLSEREWIDLARSGDPVAERRLYEAHVDRVYRLAFRMTGSDDLAQDFTQETFVRAFDRLGQFRGDAAFATWLHAIAVRVVLNAMRKVKRLRRRETELNEAAHSTDRRGSWSGGAGSDPILRARLVEAIDRLPERYRLAFVMHDVEGYTHEEIGEAMGVETGTSKSLVSRARSKLREALHPFAGEWAR